MGIPVPNLLLIECHLVLIVVKTCNLLSIWTMCLQVAMGKKDIKLIIKLCPKKSQIKVIIKTPKKNNMLLMFKKIFHFTKKVFYN